MGAFKKLPGVGSKSAERFAFDLISWTEDQLQEMAEAIRASKELLHLCKECGCLADVSDRDQCPLCDLSRRDPRLLCVVAYPKEVFAVEHTHEYRGLYHVLGGLLSPLEGMGPQHLSISKLKSRLHQHQIKEVVIALDSTLEGDATALYLKRELSELQLEVSRLAFGLPMGSSLDFVDGSTLARAFQGRLRY